MVQRKEGSRRNTSVFPGFLTKRWTIFASNPKDVQMASISNRSNLGRATSPPGGRFGPSCSPTGRLDGAINEFTP